MTYNEISPIIESWTLKNKLHLIIDAEGPNRRYFYSSSDLGETFQIVIEPERGGMVRMDAHLIESPCDDEAHFVWEVPVSQTRQALDLSLGSVRAWFRRNER